MPDRPITDYDHGFEEPRPQCARCREKNGLFHHAKHGVRCWACLEARFTAEGVILTRQGAAFLRWREL